MFSTIGFLISLVGFQIETKRKFSLVKIFINLKRCHLQQIENLRILIFVSKNLPNYARVNCKAHLNELNSKRTYLMFLCHDEM